MKPVRADLSSFILPSPLLARPNRERARRVVCTICIDAFRDCASGLAARPLNLRLRPARRRTALYVEQGWGDPWERDDVRRIFEIHRGSAMMYVLGGVRFIKEYVHIYVGRKFLLIRYVHYIHRICHGVIILKYMIQSYIKLLLQN